MRITETTVAHVEPEQLVRCAKFLKDRSQPSRDLTVLGPVGSYTLFRSRYVKSIAYSHSP